MHIQVRDYIEPTIIDVGDLAKRDAHLVDRDRQTDSCANAPVNHLNTFLKVKTKVDESNWFLRSTIPCHQITEEGNAHDITTN